MSAGKVHPRSAEGFTSVSLAKVTRRLIRKLQHDSRFTGSLAGWSADDVVYLLAIAELDKYKRPGESIESPLRESIEPARPAPIAAVFDELCPNRANHGRTGRP